ncbi:MAG TPA: hypothetical protein DCL49_05335, partial [Candidatus Omnitrophica bacterium]|nr:hypothetical protein [Candidatus Omnitrophota bacterium]
EVGCIHILLNCMVSSRVAYRILVQMAHYNENLIRKIVRGVIEKSKADDKILFSDLMWPDRERSDILGLFECFMPYLLVAIAEHSDDLAFLVADTLRSALDTEDNKGHVRNIIHLFYILSKELKKESKRRNIIINAFPKPNLIATLPSTRQGKEGVLLVILDEFDFDRKGEKRDTHGEKVYSLILSQIFGQAEIPKLEKTITIGRLKIMLISDEERDFNLQTIRNDNPDRVIIVNLSLGGRNDVIYTYNSFGVKDLDLIGVTTKMVSSLGKENVIFVTSAGNDGAVRFYFDKFDNVLVVAAAEDRGGYYQASEYTSYGPNVDFSAPRVALNGLAEGTSFSCNVVTGRLIKLLLDQPYISPKDIITQLEQEAVPFDGREPLKEFLGKGVIVSAINSLVSSSPVEIRVLVDRLSEWVAKNWWAYPRGRKAQLWPSFTYADKKIGIEGFEFVCESTQKDWAAGQQTSWTSGRYVSFAEATDNTPCKITKHYKIGTNLNVIAFMKKLEEDFMPLSESLFNLGPESAYFADFLRKWRVFKEILISDGRGAGSPVAGKPYEFKGRISTISIAPKMGHIRKLELIEKELQVLGLFKGPRQNKFFVAPADHQNELRIIYAGGHLSYCLGQSFLSVAVAFVANNLNHIQVEILLALDLLYDVSERNTELEERRKLEFARGERVAFAAGGATYIDYLDRKGTNYEIYLDGVLLKRINNPDIQNVASIRWFMNYDDMRNYIRTSRSSSPLGAVERWSRRLDVSESVMLNLDIYESHKDAPVIIFLPGSMVYSGFYSKILFRLQEAGYNVIGVDYRGHGHSEGRKGDFTFEELVKDTNKIVDYAINQFNDRIVLLGTSLGGVLALYSAAADPRIRGAVCHNACILNEDSLKISRFPALSKIVSIFIMPLAKIFPQLRLQVSWFIDPKKIFENKNLLEGAGEDDLIVHKYSSRAIKSLITAKPKDISLIGIPIMFISGDKDRVIPIDCMQKIDDRLSDKCKREFCILPNAGHMLFIEHINSAVEKITAWLRETFKESPPSSSPDGKAGSPLGEKGVVVGIRCKSFADTLILEELPITMIELNQFPQGERFVIPKGNGFEGIEDNFIKLKEFIDKKQLALQAHFPFRFDGEDREISIGSLEDHDRIVRYLKCWELMRKKFSLSKELIFTLHPPSGKRVDVKEKIDPDALLSNANTLLRRLDDTIEKENWGIKIGVENLPDSLNDYWFLGNQIEHF